MGCFVVCLLEPVAAPGLTFKASNVAFQAAPEGGEHSLSREVIKAKMPRQPCQAGNSQHSRGLYPSEEHSNPFVPTRRQSCPFHTLKASLPLKRQRAPRSAPEKHQKLGAHTTGTLLCRVCQRRPQITPASHGKNVFI